MGDVITYCGYLHHCKKLEVDLTPKMSSQLQCGFIQVQVVVHLLLQGFRVTPLVQWRFLANNELGCKWYSFCDCTFVPKEGGTVAIFMYYWMDSEKYFMHCWLTFRQYLCFMQVFMPYWNFDYTKAVTLYCGKSGRWCRSCNWGNPFLVKSTSNFCLNCVIYKCMRRLINVPYLQDNTYL